MQRGIMEVLGNIRDLRYGTILPINSYFPYLSFVVKDTTHFNQQLLQAKEQRLAIRSSVNICGGFHYFDCNFLAREAGLFCLASSPSVNQLQSLLFWGSLIHANGSLIALQAIHFMPVFILPLPTRQYFTALLCSNYLLESLFFFFLPFRFSSPFFELCNISQGLEGEFVQLL